MLDLTGIRTALDRATEATLTTPDAEIDWHELGPQLRDAATDLVDRLRPNLRHAAHNPWRRLPSGITVPCDGPYNLELDGDIPRCLDCGGKVLRQR